jgi:hypothetical protein
MKPATIRYSIRPSKPEAHLLEVRCTLAEPDPAGQRFALPAWIPGSYLIRDFARHIVSDPRRGRRQGRYGSTRSTSTPGRQRRWPKVRR